MDQRDATVPRYGQLPHRPAGHLEGPGSSRCRACLRCAVYLRYLHGSTQTTTHYTTENHSSIYLSPLSNDSTCKHNNPADIKLPYHSIQPTNPLQQTLLITPPSTTTSTTTQGICEGLTYKEIEERHPDIYRARLKDKFHYRYPDGEVRIFHSLFSVLVFT